MATYNFSLTAGDVVMQAYGRIGLRRSQINQEHILDARNELNLIGSAWSNHQPNLWTVTQQSLALIAGQTSYALQPRLIDILDAWIRVAGVDQTVPGISRSDYASYPNKAMVGQPTVFWLDKTTTPTLFVWPVPDQTYSFGYFCSQQTGDAEVSGGQVPDVPYRWLDALVWSLAVRLGYLYAPDRVQILEGRAMAAYQDAMKNDTENVPLDMGIDVSGYWA